MVEIDPLTGLPKELLAMEEIVREQQSIKVHVEKRRYGKLVTVIDGIGKSVDIVDLAKQLKTLLVYLDFFIIHLIFYLVFFYSYQQLCYLFLVLTLN